MSSLPFRRLARGASLAAVLVAFAACAAGERGAPRDGGVAADAGVPAARQTPAAAPAEPGRATGGARDLREDERRGGHTIERHVGKSEDELRARLRRERRIAAASTYADLETAERVVGETLRQAARRIDRWRARSGGRPNLAIDYDGEPARVIGRSLRRGDPRARDCHDAVVVLRWDETAGDFYVLTSYPEVRR